MKRLNLLIIALLLISTSTFAQKFKYGHLNGQTTFQKMKEVLVADTALNKYVAQFENEIKKMNEEYASKVKDYQEKEAETNDLIKKSKADQINALNEKIQKFQTAAQEEVNKKRTELYTPIVEKFNAALKTVAKKNGYTMILDNSKGVLLYFEDTNQKIK